VTLVEVMVVLLLLGLMLGISGLGAIMLRVPSRTDSTTELRRARAEAIRAARPVRIASARGDTVAPHTPHPTLFVTFLPDGRAIGSSVDPLTGTPR
jgi:type II secretory pathway pseudopilin PulG